MPPGHRVPLTDMTEELRKCITSSRRRQNPLTSKPARGRRQRRKDMGGGVL